MPTAQSPYLAAESGQRAIPLTQTLIRSLSPSLMAPPVPRSVNIIGLIATHPSCGVALPTGMVNFRECVPVCAASVVTIVFSNPSFSNPSLPPFGCNQ